MKSTRAIITVDQNAASFAEVAVTSVQTWFPVEFHALTH